MVSTLFYNSSETPVYLVFFFFFFVSPVHGKKKRVGGEEVPKMTRGDMVTDFHHRVVMGLR